MIFADTQEVSPLPLSPPLKNMDQSLIINITTFVEKGSGQGQHAPASSAVILPRTGRHSAEGRISLKDMLDDRAIIWP
jgi:hypothetical protein